MKKNIFHIVIAVMVLALGFVACQPDDFELGNTISKDALKYSIVQDAEDPNMVLLESLTDDAAPHWITPLGRSTREKDTVKLAFPGVYDFAYGVMSAGGYIQDDTMQVEITTTNFEYINDPLWEFLSGGVGNSKTWRLDYGDYGLAAGPLTYCEPQTTWVEWQAGTAVIGWAPAWSDNQWIIEEADKDSRMTFSLIDGAVMTTHKVTEGVDEIGTYSLNVDNHTITTTDATILRSNNFIANATNWNNDLVILELTEIQLMVGVRRTNEEGDYLYVWNFVSDEYAENYVPEDLPDPEPILPDGWKDDVSQVINTSIKWVLSPETPFNWANLDGSLMNADWVSPDTYADWTGMNADVPPTYVDFALTMNSADNTVHMVLPDGTESEGTYTLDEKGIYTFDGVKPEFIICGGWVTLSTTAENQWRILSIEKEAGNVTGMWVGALATDKPEYMCYKLVPQASGSDDGGSPQGTELAFDNTKFVYGDLEENGNLRLELYNDYSSTAADPPLNRDDLVFTNRIEITFTLGGITLQDDAVGNYNTAFSLADGDWEPQYWGDGTQEQVASVTGDGTYTVSYDPTSTSEGAAVFVIDIKGMAAEISDINAVTATIDKVVLF
ncbi:hypothetical protein [Carboxylicivirga sp. N1Y90]|uniref:hypothetical protein n=1 Tax=Carboxylicivirga fragile TaxID=3417571 RepID=UPI003D341232|nr:hypothetical protein [Marinilabiliaceae bacterium N1Y90]